MKAVNYADLAERALGKVLTIEDEGADLPSPIYASANAFS